VYQLRIRQVQHEFDMTLAASVGERTRIARELHDTLLQSFHGLLLRFQTASYLLPERPAEAKGKLDHAIEHAVLAAQGAQGHYGLRGMPERAALIGGKLAVWSEAGAGTEVELRLPASTGYATSPRRTWWSRLVAPKTPAHVRGDGS
jgi:signal transduction histidine kinase